GDPEFLFLDAETFLTIHTEGKRNFNGTMMDAESNLGDYKSVDGIMIPYSVESGAKGMPQRRKLTIQKVELNPSLDAAHFAMPAAAASAPGPPDTSKAAAAKKGRGAKGEWMGKKVKAEASKSDSTHATPAPDSTKTGK